MAAAFFCVFANVMVIMVLLLVLFLAVVVALLVVLAPAPAPAIGDSGCAPGGAEQLC